MAEINLKRTVTCTKCKPAREIHVRSGFAHLTLSTHSKTEHKGAK